MLFYFYGDNSYAIAKQVAKIKQTYISKTGGDADLEIFEMSERPLSDLLNSLAVVPMFVSSRLLIVRDLGTHKLQKDKIDSLISSIADSTNVVLVDTKLDKRSVYFKTLSKLKNAKNFRLLTQHELVNWIKKIAQDNNSSIENSTINVLIDRVGNDQWQLEQEMLKLCGFTDKIVVNTIDELVVPNLAQTAFMMIDSITRGDALRATKMYKDLRVAGEPDQMILGAITYQYRTMVLAKDNEGQGSGWQKQLAISPYAATKAQNLVRGRDMAQLAKAYQLIVDADYGMKSGQLEATGAMEMLIYQLSEL